MNQNEANTNTTEERVRVWVGYGHVDDPTEPFEAVVIGEEREGGLLLRGDSLSFLVTRDGSPYREFLLPTEDGDYRVQGMRVMGTEPAEPPVPAEPPELEAEAVWRTSHPRLPAMWSLRVICPTCGGTHIHGGEAGRMPNYGHRVSHCPQDPLDHPGYVLVPKGAVPER